MAKKKASKQKTEESLSITYSEPFSAVIEKGEGGKNKLSVTSKMWYQNQLNKFKPETKVTLEIHNRKPKRTDAQNRYLWGVYYPLIAKETGNHNLDALHSLFSGLFLTEKVVEVMGRKVRIKKSTTALGIGEFCDYIMNIESETGVEAPPTENYELAPIKKDELSTGEVL